MQRQDKDLPLDAVRSLVTDRRTVLKATGAAGIAALLAACGSGSGSGTKGSAGGAIGKSDTTGDEDVDFIKKTFVTDPKTAGAGIDMPIGAALLLSTSQAPYGQASLRGMQLAAKQIKAAGGPNISFNIKDVAVSTTAGADAARAFASAGIGAALGAGFFGTGSMLPIIAQSKILTFDPGGGTSTAFQSKPYAWGARAITPDDSFAGAMKYLKDKMPEAKRMVVTGYDIGALTTGAIDALNRQAKELGPEGATFVGKALVPLPSAGTPDYSSAVGKIRSMNPDVVFHWTWGSDPASFMKLYATSGLKAPVIGPDFIASTTSLAGNAFNGYMFAYDYFDANDPQNDWAKHFTSAYRREYELEPDYYPANYYEDVFMIWTLMQRVIAKGGNPKSGEELQAELMANATLPSVYGTAGDNGTGEIAFDTTTHTVSKRPMGLFELVDLKPKPLAYFGVGGADYRLA